MSAPVRALPARILFGARDVGSEAHAELTLAVPAGEQWAVDRVETGSDRVTVTPVPPSKLEYRVSVRYRESGDRTHRVCFVVARNGGRDPPVRVEVDVTYTGVRIARAGNPEVKP